MQRFPKTVAIVAGAVAATGFQPLSLWPVTLVALAVFIRLIATAATIRSAAWRGWLFGVAHFTVGLNWIAHSFHFQEAMPEWYGWPAVFLLSLYLAVYPAIAAALARLLVHRPGLPFVLAMSGAWILGEYLRATLFTGFAWNPVGAIFVPSWMSGWARLTGAYGLSGLAVLISGVVALALEARSVRASLMAATGAAVLAGGGWTWLVTDPGSTNKIVRVVQPNIGLAEGRDAFSARKGLNRLERLSGTPGPEARLIIWPEGVLNDVYEIAYDPAVRGELGGILGPNDLLMLGATRIEYARAPASRGVGIVERAIGAQNAMFLVDAKGDIRARYDKAHLVPYGEYLPMRPLLTAIGLARLVPGEIDFWAGPGPRSIEVPGFGKAGVQICYEIVFSGEVVERADRPEFLINGSIDAWFGSWGPPQHLAQAQLRAIEEGLPVIRATTTGISAIIDSRGRVVTHIAMDTEGAIEAALPAAAAATPFSRLGNSLPIGLAILMCAAGVALGRKRR